MQLCSPCCSSEQNIKPKALLSLFSAPLLAWKCWILPQSVCCLNTPERLWPLQSSHPAWVIYVCAVRGSEHNMGQSRAGLNPEMRMLVYPKTHEPAHSLLTSKMTGEAEEFNLSKTSHWQCLCPAVHVCVYAYRWGGVFSTKTHILVQIYPDIFSLRCTGRSKQACLVWFAEMSLCTYTWQHVCIYIRTPTERKRGMDMNTNACSCKHGGGFVEGGSISKPVWSISSSLFLCSSGMMFPPLSLRYYVSKLLPPWKFISQFWLFSHNCKFISLYFKL